MSRESGLRDYLRVLRRHKMVIIGSVVALVGLALADSYLKTPLYAARATVLLQPRGSESLFDPNTGSYNDPTRTLETEIEVLKSEPVQDAVRKEMGDVPGVIARGVGQTDVIEMVVQSAKPTQAARAANAYAKAYVDFRRKQAVDNLLAASEQIQTKVSSIQTQIDGLDLQVDQAPAAQQSAVRQNLGPQKDALIKQQAAFKERLDQVQVDAALTSGRGQLVTPASIPTSPFSPTPVRSAVIALFLGLLLGMGLAFLLDHLDDSINTKDDLDRALGGIPVVGLIPAIAGWKAKEETRLVSITDPRSPATEAYRTLRTSIQFLAVERPVRTLAITSPTAQEGKTTTLANLAVALASAGQRVCIACCDLRRPRIHDFFGLDNSNGLTSVLLGDAPLSSAIQAVPGQSRLSVLASGPLPPNPADLLSSARTTDVLATLRDRFDIVLIDCPPVLPVTDPLIMAGKVDAMLLACYAGTTSRKAVARTVELLRQVDAPLMGAVLSAVSTEGAYGYAYYYYRKEGSDHPVQVPNGDGGQGRNKIAKGASS